jgi:hypothetical protein
VSVSAKESERTNLSYRRHTCCDTFSTPDLLCLFLPSFLQGPVSAEESERTRLNYLSPVYKIDEVEHRKLIEEAGQVGPLVCGWGQCVGRMLGKCRTMCRANVGQGSRCLTCACI